jgi:DNA-binding Lrp family transcriptional regulator
MEDVLQNKEKEIVSLDDIDLQIIRILFKDCRIPYRQMAIKIGLTSNAIKSRVNKLIERKIIQRFLAIPDPFVFGYNREYFLILKFSKADMIRADEIIRKVNLMGETVFYVKLVGAVLFLYLIAKPGAEKKIDVIADLLNTAKFDYKFSILEDAKIKLTNSDFKIIKCLVADPRMEIKEISTNTSLSARTVSRRLEKMILNRILYFGIMIDTSVLRLIGYIESILIISIESAHYFSILEEIYRDHDEYDIFVFKSHNKEIIFATLFCANIAVLDKIMTNIDSYLGVKNVELYIVSKTRYYENWLTEELIKY